MVEKQVVAEREVVGVVVPGPVEAGAE